MRWGVAPSWYGRRRSAPRAPEHAGPYHLQTAGSDRALGSAQNQQTSRAKGALDAAPEGRDHFGPEVHGGIAEEDQVPGAGLDGLEQVGDGPAYGGAHLRDDA